eukprot:CAMPEP_0170075630 /NCGR_PEP_ID=MMETSP0019_2-20121128/12740_1 /TAXON_ID=98059 /ORGANISM="Dinobryon sp., Strain UTEXLB2267" /LENGTH=111 /DNA_ID=CAMNT_0010286737 /DNA_START=567 /DNA_END=903 /DNA_ORIENTATION=-
MVFSEGGEGGKEKLTTARDLGTLDLRRVGVTRVTDGYDLRTLRLWRVGVTLETDVSNLGTLGLRRIGVTLVSSWNILTLRVVAALIALPVMYSIGLIPSNRPHIFKSTPLL